MSDLIYNFAQSSHPGRLTQLGQMGAQAYNQFQAKKAEQERTAQYNSLLRQFNDTQDLSLIPQLQNIAPEKFEGMQKAWSMMDQIGKERQAQTFGEVLRMVKTGSTDLAKTRMEELAEGHEANGEQASADQYRKMIQQLDNGNSNAVASYLTMALGQDEVSRGVLGAIQSIDQEERAELASEADLLRMGYDMQWASDEDRRRALEVADGYNVGEAKVVLEIGSLLSAIADPTTSKDIVDAYMPIEREYNDLAQPYEEVLSNAQAINDSDFLVTGAATQAMVSLFNKVLDPESVVRQSEVDATLNAAGKLQVVNTALERLTGGAFLDEEARQSLVEAVGIISNNSKNRLLNIQEDLGALIDEAGLKREVVFKSAGSSQEIERDRARMLISAQWPDEAARINSMSLEELKREYPNTYAKISGQVFSSPKGETTVPEWAGGAEEL